MSIHIRGGVELPAFREDIELRTADGLTLVTATSAGHDELDPVAREPVGGQRERGEVLPRRPAGDGEDVGTVAAARRWAQDARTTGGRVEE